ncbi:hypothetical protein Tco_1063302, partial [Tanacetum coccineum]
WNFDLVPSYGNSRGYALAGRKAHLLEDKQIPSVWIFDEVLATWNGIWRNYIVTWAHLESFYNIHERGICSLVGGAAVAGIKRCRCDLSSDGVRDLAIASGRGQLKEDLESSMDCKMVVKEIVSRLLEEEEVSHFRKEQDIDDEGEENEEGDDGSEV